MHSILGLIFCSIEECLELVDRVLANLMHSFLIPFVLRSLELEMYPCIGQQHSFALVSLAAYIVLHKGPSHVYELSSGRNLVEPG